MENGELRMEKGHTVAKGALEHEEPFSILNSQFSIILYTSSASIMQ